MNTKEIVDANEQQLRELAGGVLNPGPWQHRKPTFDGMCEKCGKMISNGVEWLDEADLPCYVPDPAEGSLADIAYRLRNRFMAVEDPPWCRFYDACRLVWKDKANPYLEEWFRWKATSAQCIRVMLIAMKGQGQA